MEPHANWKYYTSDTCSPNFFLSSLTYFKPACNVNRISDGAIVRDILRSVACAYVYNSILDSTLLHYMHSAWNGVLEWTVPCISSVTTMRPSQMPMQPFSISSTPKEWQSNSLAKLSLAGPSLSKVLRRGNSEKHVHYQVHESICGSFPSYQSTNLALAYHTEQYSGSLRRSHQMAQVEKTEHRTTLARKLNKFHANI